MKTIFRILFLSVIFFVSACEGKPESLPNTPTAISVPLTATVTSIPTGTPIPTSTPDPLSSCKLRSFSFTNVGFGIPSPSHKLPSVGTVKSVVLFVDFPDAPASQTPQQVYSMISPNAENFFYDMSYGKMNWVLEPHFVWLRLSQPSAHYGEAIASYEGHLDFIQEAVDLADADVNFSDANFVIVLIPPEASAIGYGPAFGADIGTGYTADGKVFENGVTSGADLPNWGFLWLNHETGHTMGLPDLYAYDYDAANYDDQHRFAGGFGLMGYIHGNAPEFFAFERWQLKWLSDDQMICQLTDDMTATLSAIETIGGSKAVVVPLGRSKILVVESRRALGYDKNMTKEGALVYTVDTSIASGEGALVVYPVFENDPYRYQSPLSKGESVTVENVTVTVLDATPEGDTVQVVVRK